MEVAVHPMTKIGMLLATQASQSGATPKGQPYIFFLFLCGHLEGAEPPPMANPQFLFLFS
jgi:hypothetical protein